MANMGSYKGVEIPVGTPKAEIQKMIERIDAGSSGELTGGNKATPADVVNPSDATDRIGAFGAALNKAVDEARKNRKDATLDFMNGVVPPGALPASSFSKVLQAFNSDSAPLESTLLSSAMDFAKEQEKILEDRKNSIRDLALAVGKNGGSQETVNAIAALVESGDIDAALKVGATSLQEVEQVGNSLVKRNADGTIEVVYTAPSTKTSTNVYKSGNLEISQSDISVGEAELENSRGEDGHANTELYISMLDKWVTEGGDPQDFYKEYPPDYYLNPNDPTVEVRIKNMMKKPPAEKKTETTKTTEPEFGTDAYYEDLLK